jgi:hypothetical protein
MLELLLAQVEDDYARENFKRIQDANVNHPVTRGEWRVLELAFYKAETNVKVPHGLKFLPKDVILTSKTGAGSLTINYDRTDLTNLDLTTSGACVIRLLLGSLN